jgi:hypothetical protein
MDEHQRRRTVRRLRVLSGLYHGSFAATAAAALGTCATRGTVYVGLLVATLFFFSIGLLTQVMTWRTRCPSCHELFFKRAWSPHASWASFPTDETCGHCGFRLSGKKGGGRDA